MTFKFLFNFLISVAIFVGSCFQLLGCASAPNSITSSLNLISETEYEAVIEKHTQHIQIYSGLSNTLDVEGTIINSKVNDAMNDQYARLYIWDKEKYTQEKTKSEEKLKTESQFFVSFYTPNRKHDDLNKNKTLWKVFLDVDGKRYDGKVTKVKLLTDELRGIYPYHTRFSTPYSIAFPVAMKNIEKDSPIKLTITGPIGSVTLTF